MVTDQYSHIIDENRKDNAKLFESAFYQGNGLEVTESQNVVVDTAGVAADPKVIEQLLKNPELVSLLMQLSKAAK